MMEEQFNKLTPAEHERLSLLAEELAEAGVAIGKILRHGYESSNPEEPCGVNNRVALQLELGDVLHSIDLMVRHHDITQEWLDHFKEEKAKSVGKWLHHQPPN